MFVPNKEKKMDPNRGKDRRGKVRRKKNIPVSHDNDNRKGDRREREDRRDIN